MKSKKMHLWTVMLIIIAFILSTGISMNSLNTVIERNDQEISKVLASNVYDSINNMLSEPIIVALTMSSDYYLIKPLRKDDFPEESAVDGLISYLNTLINGMDYNGAFVVSEKSRTYYTQKGFNKIVSPQTDEHDVWYSKFVESKKKYDFDVDTDEVHNDAWTVFVNCRIDDEDGELLGVCGVSVVMTELQDILRDYEKEYNVKINLINSEGLVQVDTDMINIEKSVVDIDLSDVTDSAEYIYQEKDNGGYTISKYVENLGWYLVVQSDRENNGQIYSNLLSKNIITFGIILTICIIMVSSNLTIEKKKMEEHALEKERYASEQEALKAQAEAASKAKGDFLANMSHEIRTPINAVLGMDEMILRESTDDKILEYAADIKRAGSTLLFLINDILDFSKIESGKMDIIPVEYDLGMILNELLVMIRPRAEKKKLSLELIIEPETPAHLYGDEVRIRQIITNILTNAVKYTPQGKVTLKVSGEITGENCVKLYVSVKDTGMGIREEDKKKLFDSFQRLDENRNRNIEGTGLGLSITMQLLGLMGSRLEVESTYGEGSDFYFYLEQKMRDSSVIGDFGENYGKQSEKIAAYKERFTAPSAKILVVDDNEMNRKVFLGLLKNSKMQIDAAACGKDSLEYMKQKEYHIIFMDYLMPEMDGVETLKQAKELSDIKCKDSVFIALTANAVSGAGEMFLENGFDDFLSKPIIASKLEEIIQKYLPEELIEASEVKEPEEERQRESQEKEEKNTVQKENGETEEKTEKNELQKESEKTERKSEENAEEKIEEQGPVDWKMGKELCMNDEEFYKEMLHVFLESGSDTELQRFYESGDFENYQIKIHATKTNLINIGAKESGALAKQMELSLKKGEGTAYVKGHHEEFLAMYREAVRAVEEYLKG